jgi:hypothetical protein
MIVVGSSSSSVLATTHHSPEGSSTERNPGLSRRPARVKACAGGADDGLEDVCACGPLVVLRRHPDVGAPRPDHSPDVI